MRASGLGSTAVLRNGCPYVIDAHRWTMRDGRLACYLLVLVVPLLLYVVVCNVSCGVQFGIVLLSAVGCVRSRSALCSMRWSCPVPLHYARDSRSRSGLGLLCVLPYAMCLTRFICRCVICKAPYVSCRSARACRRILRHMSPCLKSKVTYTLSTDVVSDFARNSQACSQDRKI